MNKQPIFGIAGVLLVASSLTANAQPGGRGGRGPHGGGDFEQRPPRPRAEQNAPVAFQTLRGEAYFLERIALPPGAQLHVSLVGRVAGADYLPLGTTVLAARSGVTPFQIYLPLNLPPAPYRLQAWIVAGNRVLMVGRDAQTVVDSVAVTTKIRLKTLSAPSTTRALPRAP